MTRITALTVAVALAWTPTAAHGRGMASEPADPASASEPPPAEDPLARAKELHRDADTAYNTADYEGAIEAWKKAFKALPNTAEANPYRSLIQYNIAAAYEKLFKLRGDVEYLKQARDLLERFEASIDETYAAAPEAGEQERAQVKEKLAKIERMITEAQSKPQPDGPVQPDKPPQGGSTTKTPDDGPKNTAGRGLLIGGGVALGLGVAAGAGMAAAMVVGSRANDLGGLADDALGKRETQFDRGRRANTGAIVAGVLGLALLATGAALVGVGAKRRARGVALTPSFGRGFAGASLGGRF